MDGSGAATPSQQHSSERGARGSELGARGGRPECPTESTVWFPTGVVATDIRDALQHPVAYVSAMLRFVSAEPLL